MISSSFSAQLAIRPMTTCQVGRDLAGLRWLQWWHFYGSWSWPAAGWHMQELSRQRLRLAQNNFRCIPMTRSKPTGQPRKRICSLLLDSRSTKSHDKDGGKGRGEHIHRLVRVLVTSPVIMTSGLTMTGNWATQSFKKVATQNPLTSLTIVMGSNHLHTQTSPPHSAGHLNQTWHNPSSELWKSENIQSMFLPSMHFVQSTIQTTDEQIKYEKRPLSRPPEWHFLKTRSFCRFCFALLCSVLFFLFCSVL